MFWLQKNCSNFISNQSYESNNLILCLDHPSVSVWKIQCRDIMPNLILERFGEKWVSNFRSFFPC